MASCHRALPPPPTTSDAGTLAAPSPPSDPTRRVETVRHLVAQWNDALDHHDVTALAALYGPRVAYYGRDTRRSGVLGAKGAALGRGSTFRQEIVGPIEVEAQGDALVASFTKKSGRAGSLRAVRAKLVFAGEGDAGAPRIVAESDESTERTVANAARGRCEAEAARVAMGLPQVKRELAETQKAVDATDGGAVFGGIGPIEDDDGSFTASIGIHTDERFELHVGYAVDAHGLMSVFTRSDSDLTLPGAAIAEVERACGGSCQRQLSGAPLASIAQVPFDVIARAVIPTFQPSNGHASVADASVADCRGESASAEGEDQAVPVPPDASLAVPGAVHELGRFALADGRAAVWLGTGASDPGALQEERGFLAIVRLDGRWLVVDAVGPWANTGGGAEHAVEAKQIGTEMVYVESTHLDGTGAGTSEDGVLLWHETSGRLVLARTVLTSAMDDSSLGLTSGQCGWRGTFHATLAYGAALTIHGQVTWDRVDDHDDPCKTDPRHVVSAITRVAHWEGERLTLENAPKDENPLNEGAPK